MLLLCYQIIIKQFVSCASIQFSLLLYLGFLSIGITLIRLRFTRRLRTSWLLRSILFAASIILWRGYRQSNNVSASTTAVCSAAIHLWNSLSVVNCGRILPLLMVCRNCDDLRSGSCLFWWLGCSLFLVQVLISFLVEIPHPIKRRLSRKTRDFRFRKCVFNVADCGTHEFLDLFRSDPLYVKEECEAREDFLVRLALLAQFATCFDK